MHVVSCEWPPLNDGTAFTDHITQRAGTNQTLLEFYVGKHSNTATAIWQERIDAGQCSVDGVVVRDPGHRLTARATLRYERRPWAEPLAPAHLDVVYADEHGVVAVAKPSGLQVLPGGPFVQRCALSLLQRLAQQLPELPGVPIPVHRLGRGTSGVLLCATSPEARARLGAAFAGESAPHPTPNGAERAIEKQYLALVDGWPAAEAGIVETPIGRVKYGVRGGLHAACPGGKPCESRWSVVRRNHAGTSLLAVIIRTGRPHQIRIHMAAMGHPLVGDPLYTVGGVPKASSDDGNHSSFVGAMPGDCGYQLHSWRLTFAHPTTGARMTVVAPPPADLQ